MTFLRPISVTGLVLLMSTPVLAGDAGAPPHGEVQRGATIASPLAAQPLDRLSATREHPLFSPTRRPLPPPPPVAQAPPPPPPPPAPPPEVALYGVIMDGEHARAIIRAKPNDKEIRVGIGDDVGGWKVSQIEGQRLVLSLNGRLATFVLFTGNAALSKQPAVAPPPADKKPQNQIQQNPQIPPNPPPPTDKRGRGKRYSSQ
jgi:hypothetical protein